MHGENIMKKFGKEIIRRAGSPGGFLLLVLGAMMIGILAMVASASAQTYEARDGDRKVVKRIDPEYPDALKRLFIGGIVRVEVKVAPNGSVVSTKLEGGSPILGQASMKAIQQWKFAPAAAEQTFTVKINFDPHR
jgi:TonB family protein